LDLQFDETFLFGILSSPNEIQTSTSLAQIHICILDHDLLPLN